MEANNIDSAQSHLQYQREDSLFTPMGECSAEDLARLFREKGLRMTQQRAEIFQEVVRSRSHPGAEKIFEKVKRIMPSISLDTVYRTLTTLEELGLVRRLNHPRGGARFDSMGPGHHHFIC
ncbi:transcriptional repressor, partial [Myxococcota bacterium]|nr:transcriptional repressor [Myxococcota bacterium]